MALLRMNVNLEDVIDKIIKEAKKTKKEILKRIEAKKEDLGGLITDEGAACIVAKELGVEVFETTTYKRKHIKLKDLTVGMNAVSVIGRVTGLFDVREFTRKKTGQMGAVGKFLLQDPTDQIMVVLWNEQTKLISENKLEENEIVEIKNAYVKAGLGNQLELHLSRQGMIEQNLKGVDLAEFEDLPAHASFIQINQLQYPMTGNFIGKIQWKSNITTFEKKGGQGSVASLTIFDATGQTRVALWGKHASFVDQVEINDVVKIINGYTRQGQEGSIELHVGGNSRILKETSKTLDLPDAPPVPSLRSSMVEVKIEVLTPQTRNFKVTGKIMEMAEPRAVNVKDTAHRVCDTLFADETGCISLSIWDDDIEKVQKNKTYTLENGYVSVFRRSLKLNVGRYGTLIPSDTKITKVNRKNNLSEKELEAARKPIINISKNDNAEILGTIVSIPEKKPIYQSCPNCFKKVTQIDETSWNCERCGTLPSPVPRMLWSFILDDGTETLRVTVGGKVAEELLEMTTAEAQKMIEKELIEQYPLILKSKELLGKKIIVRGNIRYNSFSNNLDLMANNIDSPNSRNELSKILARVENYI
ncbi:MAG: DUF2240 family protein [Candidatus Helarchaeota archaeon]|nr:DUF2240 family protein [Candidatus Helarchaeota archaeon]